MSISSKLGIASATLAGLYFLFAPFSSGGAWGQYLTRSEFAQSRTTPTTKFRIGGTKQPGVFALQPAPIQPAASIVVPVAIPVTDVSSALGGALAACDKLSDGSEPIDLPGARGDVKLDRCYRGRDHLVCSFSALLTEARFLLENYKRISEANYPELGNLEAVCRIPSNTLATDLEKATDFNSRFKSLKLQYEARVNCVGSIQQSFRSVTLSDMEQAPDLLKSMIDTIQGDLSRASDIQAQVVGLAEKIDASQKAMTTILKVHRTMCAKTQVMDAQSRAAR